MMDNKGVRIRKLVILAEQPLDEWNFKRFGIDLLKKKGFSVEYWDLSPLISSKAVKRESQAGLFRCEGSSVIKKIGEMEERLSGLGEDSFILNLVSYTDDLWPIRVYRALSRARADYGVFYVIVQPEKENYGKKLPAVAADLIKKAFNNLGILPGRLLKKLVLARIPIPWLGIKPARLVFTAGELDLKYRFPRGESTEFLNCHNFDYDFYLEESGKERAPGKPTAVFLDQYLPFHPDWRFIGVDVGIDPVSYYGRLNSFFDIIEKDLGVEVVIAAHPNSDYSQMPDYFNGRKCIRNRTAELIRQSSLVIASFSASINLANLFYKPIVFVTSKEFDSKNCKRTIDAFSELHSKRPLYIDGGITVNWDDEMKVDRKAYDNYRRSYIKSDNSPDLPLWEIVSGRIGSL